MEGRNLVIVYRWSEGKSERFPVLAAELVSLKVDVIVASGPQAALAAKAATTTIPIVFTFVGDPVGLGLASSLARPGRNVTGFASIVPEAFTEKQLQLLKEMVPRAARVVVLMNPTNPMHRTRPQTVAAAEKMGMRLQILEARTPEEIDRAFEAATQGRAEAIHVGGDTLFGLQRARIVELAATNRLPAVYLTRDYVLGGGLMSYGPDAHDLLRRTAGHVDKILKGATPGDLPVEQPTKFELAINKKTAKALGLTIPQSLLLQADQVIE